jgi:VWFA-related protein
MRSSRGGLIGVIFGLAVLVDAQLTATSPVQAPAQPATRPQEERPVFRAEVELVQLDVSVLDVDRRPVTGLTAADFSLLVDGKPQAIRAFSAIRVPGASPAGPSPGDTPQSDVVTNGVDQQEGRLVMIVMDRTIPQGEPMLAARRIATAAVESLGPQDLGALLSTSGGVPQNLTSDRARLIAAISQRDWSTGRSKEHEDVVGKEDPLSDGRCLCGLCVLETVTRISDAVQYSPRRHKMLLFIGSSVILQSAPRQPAADVSCDRRLEDAVRRMRASLALSHLTVHSIDPTGLSSIGPHTRASSPGARPGEDRLSKVRAMQVEMSELLQEQGSLGYLPGLTGGRAVINTNGPEEKVPEIFAESSAYYVIAFEPGRSGRSDDGASVEVKVSRPGVRVFAQRNYQQRVPNGAPAATSPLLMGLRGLLPVATRPLALSAAAFAGPGRAGTVVVNVDVGAFGNGSTSKTLSFALSAVDSSGREIKSATRTATVTFHPNQTEEANVQTSLELPPGDYEVRMAIADAASATVSSVFAPVVVQRFAAAPLSLSDAIVQASGGVPPSASAHVVLSPTTRRAFARTEQARVVFEVYQGTMRTDPVVAIAVRNRVLDAQGRNVREQRVTLAPTSFANRMATMSVDLSGLLPGAYLLAIEASSATESARRTLPFTVR